MSEIIKKIKGVAGNHLEESFVHVIYSRVGGMEGTLRIPLDVAIELLGNNHPAVKEAISLMDDHIKNQIRSHEEIIKSLKNCLLRQEDS